MAQIGIPVNLSPMIDRNEVASSLFFWDVPRADTHAVEDIGAVVDWLTERCDFRADAKSSLAVLHNRNDITQPWSCYCLGSVAFGSRLSRQTLVGR